MMLDFSYDLGSSDSDGRALTSTDETNSVVCLRIVSKGRGGGEYIGGLSF